MKKSIILIIILFSWTIVSANFEITEIMYDIEGTDAGREWVEVKNIGTKSEDLSKWFFFSDNTKHKLNPIGGFNVPAGEYAVITQNNLNFKNDWPSYQGLIFDSSWTDFSNSGESISVLDQNQKIVDTLSYSSSQGAKGNGASLQKIDGEWLESKPTPGTENKLVKIIVAPTKTTVTSKTTSSKSELDKNAVEPKKLEPSSEIINLNEINQKKEVSNYKINNETLAWAGLGLVIIIGIFAIVLTRKNQKEDTLEKGLTAEDIKIIE